MVTPGADAPPLPQDFYRQDTRDVAQALLGCRVTRRLPSGERLSGVIVETEAYLHDDPACHAFRGETPRCRTMFGPPGRAYVYFTYGLHTMLNVVTAPAGVGEAVLIRALEPVDGVDTMRALRGGLQDTRSLTNGPGKLAQALALSRFIDDGTDVTDPSSPLCILPGASVPQDVVVATRIGLSQAQDEPWRFYVRGSPFVSRR